MICSTLADGTAAGFSAPFTLAFLGPFAIECARQKDAHAVQNWMTNLQMLVLKQAAQLTMIPTQPWISKSPYQARRHPVRTAGHPVVDIRTLRTTRQGWTDGELILPKASNFERSPPALCDHYSASPSCAGMDKFGIAG